MKVFFFLHFEFIISVTTISFYNLLCSANKSPIIEVSKWLLETQNLKMSDSGDMLSPSSIALKGTSRSSQHFEPSEVACGLANGEIAFEDKVPETNTEIVAGKQTFLDIFIFLNSFIIQLKYDSTLEVTPQAG
jgi:hypothetical protein